MSRVTYQEAETYISELPKFTKKNTLEHTQKFLSFLGNPQNGKKVHPCSRHERKRLRSACIWMRCFGPREAHRLFTSPHLIRMNERIRMDGEPVSDETLYPSCFTDTTERKENGGRRPSSSELFLNFCSGWRWQALRKQAWNM